MIKTQLEDHVKQGGGVSVHWEIFLKNYLEHRVLDYMKKLTFFNLK